MNQIHVDLPSDGLVTGEIAVLSGWYSVATDVDVRCVELLFSGRIAAHNNVLRPDVAGVYPQLVTSGFSVVIDLSDREDLWNQDGAVLSLAVGGELLAARTIKLSDEARWRARGTATIRREKRAWLVPRLNCTSCHANNLVEQGTSAVCSDCGASYRETGGVLDMLDPEVSRTFDIQDYESVSAHEYDETAQGLIRDVKARGGMVLDCGGGVRGQIDEGVIVTEIVPYPSTDLLAANQELPMRSDTFDGVLSLNVLEHVTDPFESARELVRVLKPGGMLYCVVPFLQPEHGYPHHFFNMSRSGLKHLFRESGTIEKQFVPLSGHPFWAIHWFLSWYLRELPPEERDRLQRMTVKEILRSPPANWLEDPIVASLSIAGQWKLASTTGLVFRKGPPAA